jgi:hypothetical protein
MTLAILSSVSCSASLPALLRDRLRELGAGQWFVGTLA